MVNVRISKLYKLGISDPKPKPVNVECFCMDVDKGKSSFDVHISSSGAKEAMALKNGGSFYKELPTLYNADVLGFYAEGFIVRGYCHEMLAGRLRCFYCEWFVFYPDELKNKGHGNAQKTPH